MSCCIYSLIQISGNSSNTGNQVKGTKLSRSTGNTNTLNETRSNRGLMSPNQLEKMGFASIQVKIKKKRYKPIPHTWVWDTPLPARTVTVCARFRNFSTIESALITPIFTAKFLLLRAYNIWQRQYCCWNRKLYNALQVDCKKHL